EWPDAANSKFGLCDLLQFGPTKSGASKSSPEGPPVIGDGPIRTTQPLLYPPGKREPAYLYGNFSSPYMRNHG
ncbi:hypothetical protein AVEN_84752-1, partial [Araneus ventricosus]